ncbi:hypothetical protein [Fervidobacterium thailandense]|uniref:Uncharacterized protein n=1 Tax=Fervidobacterium thailandense TaxID=1008305 RepID=A0A1E3G2F5_9BACT|nr:hypothetical protein [Fervidobacterium thailandense]ODN29828.1 hypothetical protein A4H02_08730 [Fervidobacterium thailandense]
MRRLVFYGIFLLVLSVDIVFADFVLNVTNHDFSSFVPVGSGTRVVFTPALFVSNYPRNVVSSKGSTGYVLVNPAEGIFYLHDQLPPLAEFGLSYRGRNFGLQLNFEHKYSLGAALVKLEKFTNVPLNLVEYLTVDLPRAFDTTTPHEAFAYWYTEDLFLALGRFKIKWGDARYPIHISDVTFQDNLTFSANIEPFRFTFHIISILPWLTAEELYVQSNYTRGGETRTAYTEPYRTIFAHRFDWFINFLEATVRVGLSELNLVGGKMPDLIDLSPVMFLHNTWGEAYSNVTGGLDFSVRYKDRWKIYGELVFDNLQLPTEKGDTSNPEAYAWNVGVEYSTKQATFDLTLWSEYSFISEWMYVSVGLPYLTFATRQYRLDQYVGKAFLVDYPLGFIYGPDARMFSAGLDLKFPSQDLRASFEYNYLTKGCVKDEEVIRWKWFWDRWTANIPGLKSETEPAGYVTLHIFKLILGWKNLSSTLVFNLGWPENSVLFMLSCRLPF